MIWSTSAGVPFKFLMAYILSPIPILCSHYTKHQEGEHKLAFLRKDSQDKKVVDEPASDFFSNGFLISSDHLNSNAVFDGSFDGLFRICPRRIWQRHQTLKYPNKQGKEVKIKIFFLLELLLYHCFPAESVALATPNVRKPRLANSSIFPLTSCSNSALLVESSRMTWGAPLVIRITFPSGVLIFTSLFLLMHENNPS